MQVKLLRLLESGTFRRVGSTELRRSDVRVISATHRDLEAMVEAGTFRQDLYFRLGVFPIVLPPLRERVQDLPLLVHSLLERVAPGRALRVASTGMAALAGHRWPGNVRELRNVLERAALLTDGDEIAPGDVMAALQGARPWAPGASAGPHPVLARPMPAPAPAPSQGRHAVARAWQKAELRVELARHRGSRQALAAALGISLRTLYRRMQELERENDAAER
jgi:DNA-binding NtrC family response regulator